MIFINIFNYTSSPSVNFDVKNNFYDYLQNSVVPDNLINVRFKDKKSPTIIANKLFNKLN